MSKHRPLQLDFLLTHLHLASSHPLNFTTTKMNLQILLAGVFLLLSPFTLADSLTKTQNILYWPLNDPKPLHLATATYDPTSLTSTIDYAAPVSKGSGSGDSDSDELVRIGFYNPSKEWIGTLASKSALSNANAGPSFRLHLSSSGEIYHVSLGSNAAGETGGASVEVVAQQDGPKPALNKPIVVGPDGADAEVPEEKSFLQR